MASFISGAFGPDFAANMEIDGPMTESVMLEVTFQSFVSRLFYFPENIINVLEI